MTSDAAAAQWLLSAGAVRERAHTLLARAERGESAWFLVRPERLSDTAHIVEDTIRANYPDLDIPFHSRWRHFESGGIDRWATLAGRLAGDSDERARTRFDLAIVSVLLDAGAGPGWSYMAGDGRKYTRSEGLAVASFDMFAHGLFSAHPENPLRCDASALISLDAAKLSRAMQVSAGNPMTGLDGRAHLLNRLGHALLADPRRFGPSGRIGHLYDGLRVRASADALAASAVLQAVLFGFGPIWPGRHSLDGLPLGDTWRHPAFPANDPGRGFVPLHKLSQWLTYSLIEPLEEAGIKVTDLDELTGLAEYRNGGLMLDTGLLELRDPAVAAGVLEASGELVVEWRALTVALLDRIAAVLRNRLGMDANSLPLARVLEGGTWAAGRRLARERRADGGPPLSIQSDGTIF